MLIGTKVITVEDLRVRLKTDKENVMDKIGTPENLELTERIVLNGVVAECRTGDENDTTVGVKTYQKCKRLNGEIVTSVIGEFPLTKEMEDRVGWRGSYANIQMLFGKTPIDLEHIDETKIVSMMGDVTSEYYHCYSELTGYLWTTEKFICGGHDIPKILRSHMGDYVHMEIELYRPKQRKSL